MKTYTILAMMAALVLFGGCTSELMVSDLNNDKPMDEESSESETDDEGKKDEESGETPADEEVYDGSMLVVELMWDNVDRDEGLHEPDYDLALVRWREEGTFGVFNPNHVSDELVGCESDADCDDGEYCVPAHLPNSVVPSPPLVCYLFSKEEIHDTCFNGNGNPEWDGQDAEKGEDWLDGGWPEVVEVKKPEGLHRVVFTKFDEIVRFYEPQDGSTWDRVATETSATVSISINGKLCDKKTYTAKELGMLQKVADIEWENYDCSDIDWLEVKSYNFGKSILHDPFDSEIPRSVWCDEDESVGCTE